MHSQLRYAEVARRAGGLLSIRLTPDKGRGVFAERPLEPGHRLFAELPIVLTPNPPLARSVSHRVHHSDVCFNCMRSLAAPSQALAPKVRTRMALPLADRFWPRSDARTACTACKSKFVNAFLRMISCAPASAPPSVSKAVTRCTRACASIRQHSRPFSTSASALRGLRSPIDILQSHRPPLPPANRADVRAPYRPLPCNRRL